MAENDTGAGTVVTVFRSTLRLDAIEEYEVVSARMVDLARGMAGFVDYKSFESADGERVTVVTFASLDEHRAWRDHPEHREAQRRGRERFYETYAIQVCTCISDRRFHR